MIQSEQKVQWKQRNLRRGPRTVKRLTDIRVWKPQIVGFMLCGLNTWRLMLKTLDKSLHI